MIEDNFMKFQLFFLFGFGLNVEQLLWGLGVKLLIFLEENKGVLFEELIELLSDESQQIGLKENFQI